MYMYIHVYGSIHMHTYLQRPRFHRGEDTHHCCISRLLFLSCATPFVAGLPSVAKSLHEPQLLFFSNATSHIANVVRYYISTYLSFHRSVHIYIYIYAYMINICICTYMCMAVYICIHIFKGHGFTEAKIPTIVASAVCCFCRVQRLLWRGFPLLRSHCMNHSCCLFRMQRATSLILCDTTYLIIYLPPLYRHPCGTERYSFGCVVLPLFWAPIIVCFFILDCFFVPNKCP